jgi:hypothetical protein
MTILNRRSIAAAAIVCAMALHSGASANNGIDTYETGFSFSGFYSACLGEMVSGDVSIVGLYHEFDTPSGKYHLIDHWRYTIELTGMTTGYKWFGGGFTPWVSNVGPGESFQFQDNWMVRPIYGDGPKVRVHIRVKVTVNANGELVVLHDDTDGLLPEDFYQCIGKPK